jgi:hypothetical protein
MTKLGFGSMLLASIIGISLLTGFTRRAVCQSPKANPAQPSQDALPVYVEEFFLSDAVRSERRGELQFTVDGMVSRGLGSAGGGSADLDFEYGITRRLQLGIEAPYGIQSTANSEVPLSWSTVNASVLYQFIRGNHPFAMSGALGLNLPLTSRGTVSFEPELLVAKGFGRLQIHSGFIPELSVGETSFEYNVAAVRPFAHHLFPTLEFNGRRDDGVNSFYATPGIYKHFPHDLEIGIGTPIGANSHSNPVGVIFKMTWELGGDDDD